MILNNSKSKEIVEYGDYQTPLYFTDRVCNFLKENMNVLPVNILEPTFGLGNFIISAIRSFNSVRSIFGIEVNPNYFEFFKNTLTTSAASVVMGVKVEVFNADFFKFDFSKIKSKISKDEELLILGNPPWVTTSKVSSINGSNVPYKENFKGAQGLEAMTGKGNFDISENIILRLLNEFRDFNFSLAMICKRSVARKIVMDLKFFDFSLSDIRMYNIDANVIFNVNTDACLLFIKPGKDKKFTCGVYNFDDPTSKINEFGWVSSNFVSDIEKYNYEMDGRCQLEWRQGVKHDCANVMELKKGTNDKLYNKMGEEVSVEDDFVFPLLKGSDIKRAVITNTDRFVIITQKKAGEDTSLLKTLAPRLWNYLEEHTSCFDSRKSAVYKNAPRFSIFGIGEYAFKPYKVVISGFYKEPLFSLVYSTSGKPVMVDDTCYFISFDNYKHALLTMLVLNSKVVSDFLKSISFTDSKRPYTKELLMRLDLMKALEINNFQNILALKHDLNIDFELTLEDYEDYRVYLTTLQPNRLF
ncbi:hypothetical protein [Fervidobacterium sp.]